MDDDGDPKAGWLDSLRRTSDSLLGLAQSRFELAGVELQEAKLRAINLLVWLAVAIALGTAGLLISMGALALYFWSKAGYIGVIVLAFVALVSSAVILQTIRRRINTAIPPFAATVAEFKKDRECLVRKD